MGNLFGCLPVEKKKIVNIEENANPPIRKKKMKNKREFVDIGKFRYDTNTDYFNQYNDDSDIINYHHHHTNNDNNHHHHHTNNDDNHHHTNDDYHHNHD
jgi:hypothetical protein